MLSMFFRDDIMAWYQKRVAGRTPGVQPLRTAKLQQLVHTNVRDTIGRLHQVGHLLGALLRVCGCRVSCIIRSPV